MHQKYMVRPVLQAAMMYQKYMVVCVQSAQLMPNCKALQVYPILVQLLHVTKSSYMSMQISACKQQVFLMEIMKPPAN
jgi:hypothetical protein